MKCYIDLYTRPSSDEALHDVLREGKRLGYCLLGVDYHGDWEVVEAAGREAGVRVVRVTVLEGSSRGEVAKRSASAPQGSLLFVKGVNRETARYASVNKRYTGFIVVPGQESLVDRSTKTLFQERGWGLVLIDLSHLLSPSRARGVWRYYYLSMRRAYAYRLDAALVSGATGPDGLWHPLSAIGVAELFGVPAEYAGAWLTIHPARVAGTLTRPP